jgi:hypothetical protein
MNYASKKLARSLSMPAAFGLMLVVSALSIGQDGPPRGIGLPDDWSHHRLVFSYPGTAWEAFIGGNFSRWLRTVNEPRFSFQLQKRENAANSHAHLPRILDNRRHDNNDGDNDGDDDGGSAPPVLSDAPLPRGLTRLASVSTSGSHEKHVHRRRSAGPNDLNLDWSEDMGSGAAAGIGIYPAKFSFNTTTANCGSAAKPDFVVYNTGLAGSASQASILAYDNLYTGCTGTVPSTFWAFNTSGTVVTSPVLSLDGSQVAFAQTSSSAASLVLLKWKSGSGTVSIPVAPTAVSNAAYRACTAPCMTTIAFSGGANDSGSSPFYDFAPSDALYIGDDAGKLHKFTGVFNGTPAEVGGAWPVSVSSSALGGPVFDSVSGNVFVADYLLNLASTCTPQGTNCGFLYSVNSSTGAIAGTSGRLDFHFGIVDAPFVDSSASRVYVFAGSDGNFNNALSPCAANTPCAGVYQFATNFTSGTGTETTLGVGNQFLLAGTFDNTYYTSASASSPTGHLYVVGNTGSADNTLYQVSIAANVMNSVAVAGPAIATNFTSDSLAAAGLQVSEFFNGTNDFVFVGVLAFGAPAGCSGSISNGCVMGFDVTSGTISSGTTPTGSTAEAGGISGIIIDNSSSFSGASNIYFTTLANQSCPTSGGTGGCAIQTSQAVP